MMHRAKKLKIVELNEHLICKLCKGYYIDATTIIECLHSFCRSCIVKYLETNKYCPVCDVQVHKTKPLLNIRSDRTLQDLVYKLVPRLYQSEVQRRRDFLIEHPDTNPNYQQYLDCNQHLLTIDETISIKLYYYGCKERIQRYLCCPIAVTIGHLQKLIRAKYNLNDDHHYVDILYENNEQQSQQQQQKGDNCLNSTLTLLDIAYIYKWNRKTPMELCYRIYEYSINCKKTKLDDDKDISNNNNNNNNSGGGGGNNWKEVQLRISENGEMSITGIQGENLELLHNKSDDDDDNNKSNNNNNNNNNSNKNKKVAFVDVKNNKKELPDLRSIATTATTTTATTTTVYSTINSTKCSVSEDNPKQQKNIKKSTTTDTKSCKRKLDQITNELPTKQSKQQQQQQTIINHTLNINNNLTATTTTTTNNHQLKKHSLVVVGNKIGDCENLTTTISAGTTTKTQSKPCYMPKSILNVPKTNSNNSKCDKTTNSTTTIATTTTTTTTVAITAPTSNNNNNNNVIGTNNNNNNSKLNIKSKASTPIGYKTLRDPPKSWNSQISKANLSISSNHNNNNNNHNNKQPILDNIKLNNNNNNNNANNNNNNNDLKNVRPAKFFKMRNNLPRYLGNPASGVKPMYQLHNNTGTSPDKGKTTIPTTTTTTTTNSGGGGGEIKMQSIAKIDPKTLKPIIEKASDITSFLSTTTTATTTTSLSLMNDLKINTSSVSIFNPLKLQNSPKINNNNNNNNNNERKSPKSPHSPTIATGTTTTTTTIINKRDNKLNLNFTPSNPFIPNLTSPTINPNQFLYPSSLQPPLPLSTHGFPPYDPRFMAAYHTLLYRQRMAFPATLNLDICNNSNNNNNNNNGGGGNNSNNNNNHNGQQQQKKNFEVAPISPKLKLNQQQQQQQTIGSKDCNQICPTTTTTTTTTTTPNNSVNTTKTTSKLSATTTEHSCTTTTTTIATKTKATTRLSLNKTHTNSTINKRNKETTNKNEKSLQNAVEKLKLTQNNRAKEAASCNNQTPTTITTTTTTTTKTTTPTSRKDDTKNDEKTNDKQQSDDKNQDKLEQSLDKQTTIKNDDTSNETKELNIENNNNNKQQQQQQQQDTTDKIVKQQKEEIHENPLK